MREIDKKNQVTEDGTTNEGEARRAFLKKVGRTAAKGAIAAPAVAMVLSASSRQAKADPTVGSHAN